MEDYRVACILLHDHLIRSGSVVKSIAAENKLSGENNLSRPESVVVWLVRVLGSHPRDSALFFCLFLVLARSRAKLAALLKIELNARETLELVSMCHIGP